MATEENASKKRKARAPGWSGTFAFRDEELQFRRLLAIQIEDGEDTLTPVLRRAIRFYADHREQQRRGAA